MFFVSITTHTYNTHHWKGFQIQSRSYFVSLHLFNTMSPRGSSSFTDALCDASTRTDGGLPEVAAQRNCSLSTTCLAASPWSGKWVCKNSSCGTVTHLLCLLCAAAATAPPCRADERHTVPTELKCVHFLHLWLYWGFNLLFYCSVLKRKSTAF